MISPISGSANVAVVEEIPASQIISQYNSELRIDVSRFFKDVQHIKICECLDTNFKFYQPYGIDGDAKFYEDLQQYDSYYAKWRWENGKASEFIKDGDTILDVGCGSGDFLSKIKQKYKNIVAKGLEFNDKAISTCIEKGLDVKKETIESHSVQFANEYDVVLSFQVLEHVADIKSYINASLKAVKPGGLLVIGVPNNNPYLFKHDIYHTLNLPPHHMGLWSVEAFEKLPNYFGLKKSAILVEPMAESGYRIYLKIQLHHRFPKLVATLLYKMLKYIAPYIVKEKNGRNILAIFQKNIS
jgi:2-polyprenyl-3-methyl-5-hydroxy-6-metoxy-1,4-benzoquinol methylase